MRSFVAGALACLALGCASTPDPTEVDALLGKAFGAASSHLTRQEPIEAAQLLDVVADVDKEYPGLQEARQRVQGQVSPAVAAVFKPSLLGINRPPRYPVERTPGQKVLLYVPDRLADLLDCVTAEASLGVGFYYNLHATRAVQGGGGLRAGGGVGTYSARSIVGGRALTAAGVSVLMVGAEAGTGALAGLAGTRTGRQIHAGVYKPTDPYYQTFTDYWQIGISSMTYLIGLDGAVHPLQVADFFAGFAMVDFLGDDWATSRAMQLSAGERRLIRRLGEIGGSEDVLTQYAEWARARRSSGTPPPTSQP